MNSLNIPFHQPRSKELSALIEGFYLIKKDLSGDAIKYFTFPNNYCILTVSRNCKKRISKEKIAIKYNSEEGIKANITYHYTSPIEIEFSHPVDQLTIYFKPLAINHFIQNFQAYFNGGFIKELCLFPDFDTEMQKIFDEENDQEKVTLVENYWLSKLEYQDLDLERKILTDLESGISIRTICEKYNYSRQHINTLIYNVTGKSPSDYRKIHRFRQVIDSAKQTGNLTQLGYMNGFYDQSHFIRDFKSLTSAKPGHFLHQVDLTRKNIWRFLPG
ncbi:MAG TPA: AraC family transcriptional regulator [Cytophagales bacterium]|nr:AraC family transcriptional regulator [Cytophagales bacterium]